MASRLLPHPDTPAPVSVEVDVRRAGSLLQLAFVVDGDADEIVWPGPAPSTRTEGLWRTTCFEAFLREDRPGGSDSYIELNLSPSGGWAAYAFDAYRTGMRDLALARAPEPTFRRAPNSAELTATVDLTGVLRPSAAWRLGLSAVIEDTEGRIAYLALAHAPGRPDFHHPDAFALQLTDDA